jgi:hypothetical protein
MSVAAFGVNRPARLIRKGGGVRPPRWTAQGSRLKPPTPPGTTRQRDPPREGPRTGWSPPAGTDVRAPVTHAVRVPTAHRKTANGHTVSVTGPL